MRLFSGMLPVGAQSRKGAFNKRALKVHARFGFGEALDLSMANTATDCYEDAWK